MDIKKARRKSFEVEYVEVTKDNLDEVASWCGGEVDRSDSENPFVRIKDKNAMNARQTKGFAGDLILKSNTSFKSFSKKAFKRSFETTEDKLLELQEKASELLEDFKP